MATKNKQPNLDLNFRNVKNTFLKSFFTKLSSYIDKLIYTLGKSFSYIILPMVFLTFGIVILRYCFGLGRVWIQDLVIYLHASFFIFGIPYGLLKNSHVRVDVFKNYLSRKSQYKIEIFGALFFILPLSLLVFFKSMPYVVQSILILESSPDSGGLPGRYLLKSLIPILCILVFLQSISILIKSTLSLINENDISSTELDLK